MTIKLILVPILFLTSCKTILLNTMLKDPKVENTSTIKKFQTENNFSTNNSLIIKADTSNAQEKLLLGLTVGYYIFDKNGNQICYNGAATCHGVQFRQLIEGKVDSFQNCKNNKATFQNVISETYDLDEKPVTMSQFKDADYYVVTYWQKFLGSIKGYKNDVSWMEELIQNTNSKYKFTYIKINTDLQESWGFEPGKKAKLKFKKKGNQLSMEITDFPIKQ